MDYTSTTNRELLREISALKTKIAELERSRPEQITSAQAAGVGPALIAVMDDADTGVCAVDMEGRVLYANQKCEEITGYRVDELLARSLPELKIFTGGDASGAGGPAQGQRAGDIFPGSADVGLVRKEGLPVPVRITAGIIQSMGRRIALCFLGGTGGHGAAKEALPEWERRFKDVSERSVVGMYVLQDGRFKYANSKLAWILGYELDEMIDRLAVRDVILPEDWPRVEEGMHKRTSGELESLHYEFRVVTKGGEVRNAEVYSSRTVYGGRTAIIGTYLDTTERARMEDALRESQARWQFALEGAQDGVWDWDAVTNRVFFSTRWKSMLGYAEDEVGDTLDEWDRRVHPDDKARVYADLERHFRRETEFYQSEHRVLCKDGTYKWILDRGKVIEWTEDGKPRRVIGTHTDISQRKEAEEEKRHSARLTAALEMAGAICHELNQPLQVISGRIGLLYMESTDDQTRASLDVMNDQVNRMGTITRELMGLKNYSNRDYVGTLKITDIHRAAREDGQ